MSSLPSIDVALHPGSAGFSFVIEDATLEQPSPPAGRWKGEGQSHVALRHRGAEPKVTARSRQLRYVATDAEKRLWNQLKDRRLAGYKFVRQEPIGPYFADFVCRQAKLVVEVDGGQHCGSAHDQRRDAFLSAEGYRILRFWNADVLRDTPSVLETILASLSDLTCEATG